MAIQYVRDTGHQTGNNVGSDAGSFANLPAAGNSIIVPISVYDTVGVAEGGVTDNQGVGNTYLRDVQAGPSGAKVNNTSIHSDINIGATSGTYTITVDPNDANSWFEWVGVEFSGLADSLALDKTNTALGTNTAPTVTTAATTQNDELVVGCLTIGDLSAVSMEIDLPADYSQLGNIIQDAQTTTAFMSAYKIVAVTGAQTFDGGTLVRAPDQTQEGWAIVIATYKAAAATMEQTHYRFRADDGDLTNSY